MAIDGVSIILIAAVSRNGVIGKDGDMPWHIPSDFKHFKKMTWGLPMIMGRKQFETVGKPLPGRTNIVVTRQSDFAVSGVEVQSSLEDALRVAVAQAKADDVGEVMVIGGGQIYAQAMPLADKLIISHVELDVDGDIMFPEIAPNVWREVEIMPSMPDPRDEALYKIKVYHRQ